MSTFLYSQLLNFPYPEKADRTPLVILKCSKEINTVLISMENAVAKKTAPDNNMTLKYLSSLVFIN